MIIKEVVIFVIAFLALCNAVPVEDSKPEVVPVAVPIEGVEEAADAPEADGDLESSASYYRYRPYYGGWGGGWGGGYYGGGWGRGYGGWGRGYGGHGWGRRYWG